MAQMVLAEIEATGSYAREEIQRAVANEAAGWLTLALADVSDPALAALASAASQSTEIEGMQAELVDSGLAREQDNLVVPNGTIIGSAAAGLLAGNSVLAQPSRIEPGRPYSNSRVFRDLLEGADETVRWFDNYAGVELLDALADAAIKAKVVKIVSGAEHVAERKFQRRFAQLAKEFAQQALVFEWRVAAADDLRQTHDRFLLVDNRCYNVPPLTAVRAGKRADVVQGTMSPDEFDAVFGRASDVRRFSGAQ